MALIAPDKFPEAFAAAAAPSYINTIPVTTATFGAASLDKGFPPETFVDPNAGGAPISGGDMNGILKEATAAIQWLQAGGNYPYDSVFAAAVGGYPVGAVVRQTDNTGFWLNIVSNNTTDPESSPVGWVPVATNSVTNVTMTNANVTLSPLQFAKPIIIITGALTADLNLLFPELGMQWTIINATTGAYIITCKTVPGFGVPLLAGMNIIACDGTNMSTFNYAPLNSPALTGIPTAPTAALGTSTTQLASTAFANPFFDLLNTGYVQLPCSLLIQWATVTVNSTATPITFPTPFASEVFGVFPTLRTSTSAPPNVSIAALTTSFTMTGCDLYASSGSSHPVNYIAIGV